MNDDVFVAKGYGHIWASSGYRLKWEFCGCLNDVEARAYVRTASYAPVHKYGHYGLLLRCIGLSKWRPYYKILTNYLYYY